MEPVAELLPPGVSVQAELDALNIMLPARTDTPTFGSVLALTSVLGAFIAGITMTVLFGYVALNLLVSLEASSPLALPLLIVTFILDLLFLFTAPIILLTSSEVWDVGWPLVLLELGMVIGGSISSFLLGHRLRQRFFLVAQPGR